MNKFTIWAHVNIQHEIITHVYRYPVVDVMDPESVYGKIPGHEYRQVSGAAKEGDAIHGGEVYPRPDFAVEFDPDLPGWVIDEAAALENAKQAKITAIDTKTAELIKKGFAFNGERFSMSEAAQRNWIALSGGLANNMLPFPLAVSTVDEKSVILNSADELKMFLGAYMLYQSDPSQPLASGRVLKEAVTAATTIEEVNAVVDDRE